MRKYLVLALSSLIVMGCGSSMVDGDGVLKIGVIAPLSGNAAQYGEETQRILAATLADINANGGYNGSDVELIFEDGKCSGSDAVTAFQKLVDIDGVDAIIPFCSSESLAIAPLTESVQMLAVTGTSSNPEIEGASPYLFSFSYSDAVIGEAIVEQLDMFEKIAIISEQNDYNIGLKNIMEENLEDKIVVSETFEANTTDFRNSIEKLSNSGADAIFLNPFPGPNASNLAKQMSEDLSKFEGVQFVSQIAYLTDESRAGLDELTSGMIVVDSPMINTQEAEDFYSLVETEYGSIGSLKGYLTLSLSDALTNLVNAANNSSDNSVSMHEYLTSNPLVGKLADGIELNGKSFLPEITAAVFKIEDGKSVLQK
jgi:ABC-type branched-subunit amino acid transport system substrate-binding protein